MGEHERGRGFSLNQTEKGLPGTFLQKDTQTHTHARLGAFCLDVRTLTFCQLMGFPLNH